MARWPGCDGPMPRTPCGFMLRVAPADSVDGMTEGHIATCFIRVDVHVPGAGSEGAYDTLSERLQDFLQESILAPPDDGEPIDLRGMTCLVLGPLPDEETMDEVLEYEDHFRPVTQWLATQPRD